MDGEWISASLTANPPTTNPFLRPALPTVDRLRKFWKPPPSRHKKSIHRCARKVRCGPTGIGAGAPVGHEGTLLEESQFGDSLPPSPPPPPRAVPKDFYHTSHAQHARERKCNKQRRFLGLPETKEEGKRRFRMKEHSAIAMEKRERGRVFSQCRRRCIKRGRGEEGKHYGARPPPSMLQFITNGGGGGGGWCRCNYPSSPPFPRRYCSKLLNGSVAPL